MTAPRLGKKPHLVDDPDLFKYNTKSGNLAYFDNLNESFSQSLARISKERESGELPNT